MTITRRAIVEIKYLGKDISQDLAPYLISFTYNDNEGKSDEIQIELEDREKKWQGPWLPQKDDEIQASVRLINWKTEGTVTRLNCGTFYIDEVSFKGPPDKVTIKALSIPFKEGGKNTKYTRSWEKVTLRKALEDVAASSGLTLLYDAPEFFYERLEQVRQTNLTFAKEASKREGLATKVTDKQLIVYDESMYEKKNAVRSIKRGEDDLKSYDFKESATDKQYKKIQITYKDKTKKKPAVFTYDVPGVQKGPTLKMKKQAKSLDEAKRWAKAEAHNKNKKSKTGKLTVMGDENLIQGVTINAINFGAFDSKYYIESSSHKVTGGYTTDISIREVSKY